MTALTILGSGTAVSQSRSSGYLLTRKGRHYLIDCGEGIRHRLNDAGVDYFEIEAVFISHFHPDHFNLETLIQSIMVRNFMEKAEKSLTVFGPPETGRRFKSIWDAKHNTGNFENTLPKFVKLDIREYEDGKLVDYDGMKFTARTLKHGNMPAYTLRFEVDGKIFTYSGDSGINPNLDASCRSSDLFLCECNQRPGTENEGHLNARQVGEIASRNKVRKVVLTHMPGLDTPVTLTDEVSGGGYEGQIKIAQDLDVFQL